MCWSFEVSLGTLIIATVCSGYLYMKNERDDRLIAVYIFAIGIMQGADAMAWYSIEKGMRGLNKISAIISRIIITIQIPAIYWYLYKKTGDTKYLNVVIGFVGYFLYVLYLIWADYDTFEITEKCGEGCHLDWSWLYPIENNKHMITLMMYILLALYPLYEMKDQRKYLMIGIPGITLVYAIYEYGRTRMWGSYWCWVINLWSIVGIMK